jgi:hypothetical protein
MEIRAMPEALSIILQTKRLKEPDGMVKVALPNETAFD